jgi:dephospho-CoA kinase
MTFPDRIVFTGKMGVGKSYAANLLVQDGWKLFRFADPLKSAAAHFQDHPTRELLQSLATVSRSVYPHPLIERMREQLDEHCMNSESPEKIVIDDARFPDELALLADYGFVAVRLVAPVSVRLERLEQNGRLESVEQLRHDSENALDGVLLHEIKSHSVSDEELLADVAKSNVPMERLIK